MKKKIFINLLFALIFPVLVTAEARDVNPVKKIPLKSFYNSPAQSWESQALPIGNGYMGAMIFGGVESDKIQINEKTLWSGGPGKNPNYDGGHNPLKTVQEIRKNLQNARRLLQEKMTDFSKNQAAYIDENGMLIVNDYTPESPELRKNLQETMGIEDDFGSYQTLGNIIITDNNRVSAKDSAVHYSDYRRLLDIDNALASVMYKADGVTFHREYFMSYPKNVMAIKYTANKKGALSKTIQIETPQPNVKISTENNVITMTGSPADQRSNGLKFAQQLKVIAKGGTIRTEEGKIVVENADEFVVLMSAATNYRLCMDDSFNFLSSLNPLEKVKSTIKTASKISYDKLKTEHVADYKSLFDKMQLSFSNIVAVPSKPTDMLLSDYKKGMNTDSENTYLELLYFQFGRYLLIASSRKNSLPANLQGVWAEGLKNPWNADYHTNINLQMNYWLAEQTNLSECHIPVIDYINTLVPRGRKTAKLYYCKQDGADVRGWTINHENNIWANTAPSNWYSAFYFPTAAAWCCQDIWEYYQFNSDKKFLAENYTILLEAALFWVDNLWTDSRDGKLVTNPAYSPEHGNFSIGTSADQAIITELFDFVIKASEVLDKNSFEIEEIKTAKAKLLGPQIGLGGQFMEWRDEIALDVTGDNHHRHVNHLHWLHPGSQIVAGRSADENRYVEAMEKTLETRGDGGTGWSKAWKINFWARLRDGNRSHKLLQELLKESTLQNLFDTHPPFQIDGNFGATAGVAEMLVQSQSGKIEILPALPDAWSNGSVKGIKARGNFEVNIDWQNLMPHKLEIISRSGNTCVLKYPEIANFRLFENGNKNIPFTKINDDEISFPTRKNGVYTIKFIR